MLRLIKRNMFVSCNGPEKNRVGRLVKTYFWGSKICVLCMVYVGWKGRKNFRVGIFLNKNLLG